MGVEKIAAFLENMWRLGVDGEAEDCGEWRRWPVQIFHPTRHPQHKFMTAASR